MWLTRLALRNPIFILMMSLMVIALGVLSLSRLSVDLFPNIDIPVVRVVTFYSGAGPEDIEKSITQPIERAVSSAPGVERVESTSKQGASLVVIYFAYGTNLDSAQFEVSQRVTQVQSSLPPGIQQPYLLKFDVTNIPVAQLAIQAEGLDERQIYDLAYNVVQPQIERLSGVATATVSGGKTREIQVEADADQLRARGLGILDIVGAVRGTNLLLPSGHLRAGPLDYNVFANTQVESARALENVVVRQGSAATVAGGFQVGQSGAAVRLGEVATVEDSTADQLNIVRVDGRRGVYMRVFKQPGSNTIAVIDGLRKAIPNLRNVPPTLKVSVAFDQSTYIRAAVTALEHEAVQGGLLAIGVILIFLVSMRATAIVSVAIPLSVIATFILLYFFGQTLNVFTLGGLALGVGRLVDDSIVELENIHRHLQNEPRRHKAVLDAAQEVAMPILVSTITTVIVFFPVLFLTGVAKSLFVPLALTITFALIVSFFVSRTVTPLLCLSFLEGGAHSPSAFVSRIVRVLDRLDAGYAKVLQWVLGRRRSFVVLVVVAFSASLLLSRRIGTEFFPQTDEAQVGISYKAPIGTRVEETEAVSEGLERIASSALTVKDQPQFETVVTDNGLPGGRSAIFTTNTGSHSGNIRVNLVRASQRGFSDVAAMERIRAGLKTSAPGVRVFLSTGGIVKNILNFGATAPIDVEILGYDLDEASAYGNRLLTRMRGLADASGRPLLTDLQLSREENYPQLDISVDREKAGVLGLTQQQVAQTVLTSLVGNNQFAPIPFTDPTTGFEYFVNVRLEDKYRSHVHDLSDIFLRTPAGTMLPLNNVARVTRGSGPVTISRKYLQRVVDVTANVGPDVDLGAASAAVEKVLANESPPDGFSVRLSGQTLAQKQAFAGLGLAILMALALVYMVLASQFKSLVDPLVIMFSVPLGISGVILMLWATKTTLSVNSAMGAIMMVGIVVSNGVLLVDYANVLRERGLSIHEATVLAAKTRLRPILMTTIATIVGLIPMALGIGEGSETNLPLARAVIGGLTVSTAFTLFLIPTLYTLLDRLKRRRPDDGPDAEDPTIAIEVRRA